jgi:hypothetical protein
MSTVSEVGERDFADFRKLDLKLVREGAGSGEQ